jgi:alpha-tubulin suppressor-like RCC1 family protein
LTFTRPVYILQLRQKLDGTLWAWGKKMNNGQLGRVSQTKNIPNPGNQNN